MKSKSILLVLVASILFTFTNCSRKATNLSFAFYNVENLFDTINDPAINDEDFLPESENPWNTERYNHKLDQLTKVMNDIDKSGFPSIFGLCEVENKLVVEQLINHPALQKSGYQIIHKDSPDERGIDVALLYQPSVYQPLQNRFIRITLPENPDNKTRDILYSKGLVSERDTLHLFINHWVSRWGGQEETEPARQYIAGLIKTITDSIMQTNPDANILIAGDLNDNPTDASLLNFLQAKEVVPTPTGKTLYNMSLALYKSGEGSLYYKSWDMFDQIIVSTAMLTGAGGMKVAADKQTVIKHDYLLFKPKNGEPRPNRTASGKKYFGGFSDHLPVYLEMTVK
ncbi:MAG: endonuclease [Bacteroidetes bacterium CG18_big_fil_WC_8_21_14_2_50_41_14]|nr:MAG: endonuclease [Bacteroidetes bacterium CG18_big_fil_WC_8_21_14_2_50_41_14]PJB58238.1 MAG: endonuclease [Bacteroidetes bacterium CG_4_9_14_3_um_filter_41_19]